jgi:hypothetical protein
MMTLGLVQFVHFPSSYFILWLVSSTVIFWTGLRCWSKSYSDKVMLLLYHSYKKSMVISNWLTVTKYPHFNSIIGSSVFMLVIRYQEDGPPWEKIPPNRDNYLVLIRFWRFTNISAISWRLVLVVEEASVPGENHRPWASNWQTLSLAAAGRVHPVL